MRIALSICFLLLACDFASAGFVQWRNRVPAGEANPNNVGSYTNTIEIGNGGTTGYDVGLDVDLDTSFVPNNGFFVSYIDQDPNKVEYEFTQYVDPGESYTAFLSFENRIGNNYFASNTIEFLQVDGTFMYELKVDTMSGQGNYDYFDLGLVTYGEIDYWWKLAASSDDHRNGWFYGELTITNVSADYDHNGRVDGLDFLEWQRTPTIDLSYWESQYGDAVLTAASTVPEPTTCTLALAALCLVANRRRL